VIIKTALTILLLTVSVPRTNAKPHSVAGEPGYCCEVSSPYHKDGKGPAPIFDHPDKHSERMFEAMRDLQDRVEGRGNDIGQLVPGVAELVERTGFRRQKAQKTITPVMPPAKSSATSQGEPVRAGLKL
jgi:hypothetical protein